MGCECVCVEAGNSFFMGCVWVETVSSAHDLATVLKDLQQLWQPAQDLNQMVPANFPACIGERLLEINRFSVR